MRDSLFDTRVGDEVRAARALFPSLAAQLDQALERHQGDVPSGESAGQSDDALLDAEVSKLRDAGLISSGVEGVSNPEARERLRRAFESAQTALSPLELTVPEPELFEDAGADLRSLGELLSHDSTLEPVVAPHGLTTTQWHTLFEGRNELLEIDGVVFASEVEREFSALNHALPAGDPRVITQHTHGQVLTWSLRLIPASEAPAKSGLSHEHGPHVTLPELLMLQLNRALRGEEPLDSSSFTWVEGTIGGGRLAARHVYDAGQKVVRISCRDIGHQGPHLGARSPAQETTPERGS